ncbi:unnamed protein product [Vitrella brassicaformis CCMP3155]|uniref:Nucleoside diphosphate kinase-like domain-containing protein n=1 Tax=Vitrella brassicaformis (strain CCMP3155) TaxID=1169540 RepID=A0A0G4GFK6_VITBC|nr:unnamed protein product [Vitrella brassicaformis CCMP3155]|eukprot:CEM28304.1 unnamed protein product [Vitrella brassicaformis CCMP3155]
MRPSAEKKKWPYVTFALIKPDGHGYRGVLEQRLKREGFTIRLRESRQWTLQEAMAFLWCSWGWPDDPDDTAEMNDGSSFNLTRHDAAAEYLSSGMVEGWLLERPAGGATGAWLRLKQRLRVEWAGPFAGDPSAYEALLLVTNKVHGPDAPSQAAREIEHFFSPPSSTTRPVKVWRYRRARPGAFHMQMADRKRENERYRHFCIEAHPSPAAVDAPLLAPDVLANRLLHRHRDAGKQAQDDDSLPGRLPPTVMRRIVSRLVEREGECGGGWHVWVPMCGEGRMAAMVMDHGRKTPHDTHRGTFKGVIASCDSLADLRLAVANGELVTDRQCALRRRAEAERQSHTRNTHVRKLQLELMGAIDAHLLPYLSEQSHDDNGPAPAPAPSIAYHALYVPPSPPCHGDSDTTPSAATPLSLQHHLTSTPDLTQATCEDDDSSGSRVVCVLLWPGDDRRAEDRTALDSVLSHLGGRGDVSSVVLVLSGRAMGGMAVVDVLEEGESVCGMRVREVMRVRGGRWAVTLDKESAR